MPSVRTLPTKSGIHIPATSGAAPKYECICGAEFTRDQPREYQQHVVKCVRQNEAEIRGMSKRVKHPGIFGDEGVDVEYRHHLRNGGRG